MSYQNSQGRSGPGCFGYGCLIAVVLFVVVMGGIALYAVSSIRGAVEKYTTTTAQLIVGATVTQEEVDAAEVRYQELVQAYNEERAFSADFSEAEVRALLKKTAWNDRTYLSLVGDEVHLRFAFPLSAVGEWKAASSIVKGIAQRRISGSAKTGISVKDGRVVLSLSELVLNDHPLEDMARSHASEWIGGALNSLLADHLAGSEQERAQPLRRVRQLTVSDGRLMIDLQ